MISAQKTYDREADSLDASLSLLLVSACRLLQSKAGAKMRSISVSNPLPLDITNLKAIQELSESVALDYGLAADIDVHRRGVTIVVRR